MGLISIKMKVKRLFQHPQSDDLQYFDFLLLFREEPAPPWRGVPLTVTVRGEVVLLETLPAFI